MEETRIGSGWRVRGLYPQVLFDLVAITLLGALFGVLLLEGERALGPLWIDRTTVYGPRATHDVITTVMRLVTRLGEEAALAVGFLSAAWLARRKRGVAWSRYFILVGIGGLALDNLIKPLVGRPRPVFEQLVPGTGPSLPSGHVVGTTALLFALAYVFGDHPDPRIRRSMWAVAASGSVAMAASRIYLGVHWPSDTLIGIWLGALWARRCFDRVRLDEMLLAPVRRLPTRPLFGWIPGRASTAPAHRASRRPPRPVCRLRGTGRPRGAS